jgi:TolB-like protein
MTKVAERSEHSLSMIYRFGSFEADCNSGELHKHGVRLKLVGQPFEILRVLLERPGKVVSRGELRSLLWPDDTFLDFDHGLNAAVHRLREALGDSHEKPRYVQTVPRRGYRFIAQVRKTTGNLFSPPRQTARKSIRSLAVLPVENLSRDSEQEYFSDGMTEALITDLAKIGALRVISRTSVMGYKGVRKPLAEIAQELNVEGIVEGSVLRVGGHVRISAKLVRAGTDKQLWANSYQRHVRDVLALQAEVARAIAAEIRVRVTPRERKHLRVARKVNPKAHESYLLGRYHWNKRTFESLDKSLEHFRAATEIDPSYALAYAGIADTYVVLGGAPYERVSPQEAMPEASVAAQKALEIDTSLGEAHATLAFINWLYQHKPLSRRRT